MLEWFGNKAGCGIEEEVYTSVCNLNFFFLSFSLTSHGLTI
jgi:hypothetical protein